MENLMKNQAGSSRMDTVLKLLLIAFISLLAFSSGVYFGKQMSDSDYQLKALESDFGSKSKMAEHKEGATPEDAIAEDEVNALSEKFVNAEKDSLGDKTGQAVKGESKERKVASEDEGDAAAEDLAHHNEAAHHETAAHHEEAAHESAKTAHPQDANHDANQVEKKDEHTASKAALHETAQTKPDLSAAHRAATRVANNAVPVSNEKPKTARAPTSLPKTVGASGDIDFTVQVASYPTMEAAKQHAADLVKRGFPAFPVEATVAGKTWYRVSVGSFKNLKEATSFRNQLVKQADVQSAIVQRIQR
jgi:cell division protein FtsN